MAAAILLPASLAVFHAERLLLAETDGAETIGRDAQGHEILFDGVGAAIAQAEVVFGGGALIAMAFDSGFDRRVLLQEVRGRGERGASVGTNVGLVVVEISVTHFLREKPIEVNLGRWRRRRRRVHGDGCGGTGGAAGTGGRNRVSGRVGRRDLGGALSSDGADVGSDTKLGGIGGVPAQSRRLTLVDGSRTGLQRHGRGGSRRRWCDGFLAATKSKESGGHGNEQAGAIERACSQIHSNPPQ